MTKTHVRDFTKKRNYVHFRMRGIVASLSSIEESGVITPEEIARLKALRKSIENFNKELFSVSSRRLAKQTVNGID